MKVSCLKVLGASFALALLGLSASAQTGIGTITPRSTLDVNGAISVAETTAGVTGNAATIPTGFSLVRLTGGATAAVTLTAAASPVPVAGQLLTIFNTTTWPATLGGQTIAAGQTLSLVYSGSAWQGTAGGGNATTASNGLTKTGNNFALGGTLTDATTVVLGTNNLNFTSTAGRLVLQGNTNGDVSNYVRNSNPGINANSVFQLGNDGSNSMYLFLNSSSRTTDGGINVGTLRNDAGDLRLQSKGGFGMGSLGMTIASTTGNVGIGTATPAALLDVNGSTRLRGLTTAGLVTTDANGNLSSASAASLNPTTASNGLTKTGNDIALGGTLTGATTVDLGTNAITFTTTAYAPLLVQANTNGGTSSFIGNSNAGSNAFAQFGLGNDAGFGGGTGAGTYLFLNSSTRTTDGGINTATLRNDGGDLRLQSKGGVGMTVASTTGNVGIGTATPAALLDVNGSTRLRGLTTAGLVTTDASGNLSSASAASLNPTTASNGLTKTGNNVVLGGTLTGATDVATAGNNLTFSGTGNVGIGTTTPNAPLQLANTTANRKLVLYDGNNNDHQFYGFGISGGALRYQVESTGANHVFYAATTATTSTELMRITGTGNVGIGTNAPNAPLQLANTTANRKLVLYDGNNNDHQFYGFGISGGAMRYQVESTGANHVFYAGTNATTSTELMRITGTGNVGIGTNDPSQMLDVNGTARLRSIPAGGGTVLLTADDNGVIHKQALSATASASVAFSTLGAGVQISAGTTRFIDTGSKITIPARSKYILQVYMLMATTGGTPMPADQSIWVRSTFSDTPGTLTQTSDIVGASTLVSGGISSSMVFNMMIGSIVVFNTSAAAKTYYYFAGSVTNNGYARTVVNFGGGGWAENQLFGIPTN